MTVDTLLRSTHPGQRPRWAGSASDLLAKSHLSMLETICAIDGVRVFWTLPSSKMLYPFLFRLCEAQSQSLQSKQAKLFGWYFRFFHAGLEEPSTNRLPISLLCFKMIWLLFFAVHGLFEFRGRISPEIFRVCLEPFSVCTGKVG